MRKLFILKASNENEAQGQVFAKNLSEAKEIASWASQIIKVEGGWSAFECNNEARIWRNQK